MPISILATACTARTSRMERGVPIAVKSSIACRIDGLTEEPLSTTEASEGASEWTGGSHS